MHSKTLRWIILITTLVIGLLFSIQLFWLNKIYHYEKVEFKTGVIKSIRGVFEDMNLNEMPISQLQNLIKHPDENSFLFRIDSIPPKGPLLSAIANNLQSFQVFADCKVAVFDSSKFLYGGYLPGPNSKPTILNDTLLKSFNRNYPHIYMYFPTRSEYILSTMWWWIISGIIMMVVLLALGFSIFFLYKQKFLNEIQNDFIQNVTHEFQTPLTTLMVGLEAITKPAVAQNRHKYDTYIKLMQSQAVYLKYHIENLMKVLKSEANGRITEKSDVNPNELVESAIAQLQSSIEEKNAVIQFVPEKTNQLIIADDNSLYVAVLNLISNAIKFSNEPVINIENKINGNKYWLIVKDNGIGIDEKLKKNLFKKFYRIPTGDIHNVKGLGLGLYFVKKVITEHKGTIDVKSTLGKGSEFIIELPIH